MDLLLYIKGVIIGLSIAAPVGPIGVLCIQRTLNEGRKIGFISGLGAASADAIYGCIAGLGLTIISGTLISYQFWIRLIGGAFLILIGIKTFIAKPSDHAVQVSGKGLIGAYISTFFLTLTNPMTIIFFVGIFAGMGIVDNTRIYTNAISLVLGVFSGSLLWWFILSYGTSMLHKRTQIINLKWINIISGVVLFLFGTVILNKLY